MPRNDAPPHPARALLPTAAMLLEDTRGTLAVEYLILVSFIGLVVAIGVIFVGFPLLHQYRFMQLVLASPAV